MKSYKQCINLADPELPIDRVSLYFNEVSFRRKNNPVSEALQPKVKIWQKRASGDIKYLTCHITLQSNVIEGSSNFMSGCSSWYITTLPSFVVIGGDKFGVQ